MASLVIDIELFGLGSKYLHFKQKKKSNLSPIGTSKAPFYYHTKQY